MNLPHTFPSARLIATALLALLPLAAGCDPSGNATHDADAATTEADAAVLPEGLFLSAAPRGVESIATLKQTAEEGDEVVTRAVVGGRIEPIVDGRASATIVDAGLENTCLVEEDHCPTPWDYCCQPPQNVTGHLATLQVVDANGRVLAADLSQRIEPLSTLVVRGVVGPRPDPQVLTINANGIYVEPTKQ